MPKLGKNSFGDNVYNKILFQWKTNFRQTNILGGLRNIALRYVIIDWEVIYIGVCKEERTNVNVGMSVVICFNVPPSDLILYEIC